MEESENIKDMSIYEASDFWDEHDFGEFDDIQEEKEMQFLLKKKKYVGIDTELYAIIKRLGISTTIPLFQLGRSP